MIDLELASNFDLIVVEISEDVNGAHLHMISNNHHFIEHYGQHLTTRPQLLEDMKRVQHWARNVIGVDVLFKLI